ncbi:hypothetical protein [Mesorhizobium sp. B2-4-17]|uniref:hypothetical protein n=1 Tax=Mesorhizobium sp. B2-4-17 TaxID=2589932 RepID=UPI001129A6B2|nr:hypothetical protein [Mesorhizobium sp. B2-4-17]TPK91500.1 hypothetical protein FJ548_04475 [Mesorhizobium sp. B2-4-17]
MLLVEQNARLALELADPGYVLEVGRIVLEGTSDVLMKDLRLEQAYHGGTSDYKALRSQVDAG